jgi:hypothetical protein
LIPPVPPPGDITWIKVEKPLFDLVGVVLSSFKIAGLVAGTALVLGGLLGALLILRHRRGRGLASRPPSIRLETGLGPEVL